MLYCEKEILFYKKTSDFSMNDILLHKAFAFQVFSFNTCHHSDNSAGIPCHFIARLRRGSVRMVTLEKKEYVFSEGDVFYLPLGFRYFSHWKGDEKEKIIEWESYGFTVFPGAYEISYLPQKLTVKAEQENILDEILADMTATTKNAGLIYLFLDSVMRDMQTAETDSRNLVFERAKKYMEENLDFRVSGLARHCNMSESGLYTMFREKFNITPIGLKNQIKVERAVRELELTSLSVEEISDRLGFPNTAYFRKIVKRYTGKTPSAIRKEFKHI